MAKQKTMLSHIIENLGSDGLAQLTDAAQEMFPDVAATFGQREPNRRETWMIGLMAGHTWRRQIPYKEFFDAFRAEAIPDTYSESSCRRMLISNLDVCCPGWALVTEQDGSRTINFPPLADARAACDKAFGKRSWPPTDEVAMVPIREAEELKAKVEAEEEAYQSAILKTVMERRETLSPSELRLKREEGALRAAQAGPDPEAIANAKKALTEAQEMNAKALRDADDRQEAKIRDLRSATERLEG